MRLGACNQHYPELQKLYPECTARGYRGQTIRPKEEKHSDPFASGLVLFNRLIALNDTCRECRFLWPDTPILELKLFKR